MTVDIISVGNLKEKYLREAVDEYEKRLGGYCTLRDLTFKSDADIPALLAPRAYKIALCIEGKELSSEALADKLSRISLGGCSHIQFIIGGADGIPESVKKSCDERMSFSPMTFPHQLMRVLLLEQLYRAFNINSGGKYHH